MFFDNFKPWMRTADGDIIKLNRTESEDIGIRSFASDDGKAKLTLRIESNGETSALYVKAQLDGKCFAADYAAGVSCEAIEGLRGWMADAMRGSFWMQPAFGSDLKTVPADTQALLWETEEDRFGLILPVCDKVFKCNMFGSDDGLNIGVTAYYDKLSECDTLAFIYAEGSDPTELCERCVTRGFELLGTNGKLREDRRYPELFEYLGWCSWDALEIRVNTNDLIKKCAEFKVKDIPVRWAIIDDMWAEVKGLNDCPKDAPRSEMFKVMHSSKLYDFEADHVRFPDGLRDCITRMKEDFDIMVGMWHPTTGYWRGIDPDGKIAKEYGDLLFKHPDGWLLPDLGSLEKSYLFYNAFHSFLRSCGADFVKVDNQSFIRNYYKNILPVGEAARTLHRAVESSVGVNFDGTIINCMGMANENLWNRPNSAVSRCSDDFQPENRAWFIKHLLQCSYNSLIQGTFLWCDWDMWWTDDEQAVKNSVLRAISGGPIYISDKLDRSDAKILKPLCFSDGRILRCDKPAIPTTDCIIRNAETDETAFKIWNTCGDSGVVAAFNIHGEEKPVTGSVSADDCELSGDRFAVYERFTEQVWIIDGTESIDFTLKDHDDFRLFLIVPFDGDIAILGNIDKFIAPIAVVDSHERSATLYEGGTFAFVTDVGRKHKVTSESGTQRASSDGYLFTVKLPIEDRHVTID